MPSPQPFAVADYPFPLTVLTSTKPRMDQVTGDIVPVTETATLISGHIDFQPVQDTDVRREPGGIIEEGQATLYTAAVIPRGARLKVALDAAGTRTVTYKVMDEGPHPIITKLTKVARFRYLLMREDKP